MFEPFDWNGNGEHDFFDDFMTYKLVMGELDEEEGEEERACNCFDLEVGVS